eukprot:GHVN01013646.1.p2 GENE.GHVN01013646.1~~GHVN01013646.1.p2  ORF type:complete len:345 (-),score=47.28 GHVN01013646.1:2754-3788(-)
MMRQALSRIKFSPSSVLCATLSRTSSILNHQFPNVSFAPNVFFPTQRSMGSQAGDSRKATQSDSKANVVASPHEYTPHQLRVAIKDALLLANASRPLSTPIDQQIPTVENPAAGFNNESQFGLYAGKGKSTESREEGDTAHNGSPQVDKRDSNCDIESLINTSASKLDEVITEFFESRDADSAKRLREVQDKYVRALADAENVRVRTRKELDNSKHYAISKFASSMLEVADNLSMALHHAEDMGIHAFKPKEGVEPSNFEKGVGQFLEGVHLTQNVLQSTLKRYDVEEFNPMGEVFDPNLHEALFDMPHAEAKKGTIVQVIKTGYKIHDRVLRAAKVGTSRGPG